MEISTYLSAIVKAEQRKAVIVEHRRRELIDVALGNDTLAIRWRCLNHISETAQRRLLAVSEAALKPLAEAASDKVVSEPRLKNDTLVLHAYGQTDHYISLGDVRRARRALGMK